MIKERSFLNRDRATVTCMVQADNPDRIRYLVEKARAEGAEAIGMQFCRMKPEYRSREVYKELFDFASPLPVYVTNYRTMENAGRSDEVLAEELIELAECGATLCDVMGDTFDRPEGEPVIVGGPTKNDVAIKKQIELIEKLHERGAEVLLSSHLMKFTPADEVLEIAREYERRGADIAKIVVEANSMEEQIENLRILDLLKRSVKIPFLFLSGGESRIIRLIGGSLGSCMSLCVYERDDFATKAQPLLRDMLLVRDGING